MKKAPANLFGDRPAKKSETEPKNSHLKDKVMVGRRSGGNAGSGIWVGVHEINAMSKAAKTKPKSGARLRQEELMRLGADGPKRGATPLKIGRAMDRKKKELEQKRRMRDRDVGMATEKKVKDYWDNKLEKSEYLQKIKGNRSGLSKGNRINTDALVGKYRDGVLSLSKEDIEAVRSKRKK